MSNTHWLKVWPEFYDDVSSGTKPFEVRIDDRVPQYEAGDTLILAEWDNTDGKYTGRDCEKIATYVLRDDRFVKEGFCIIGIKGEPSDLIRPVRCGECVKRNKLECPISEAYTLDVHPFCGTAYKTPRPVDYYCADGEGGRVMDKCIYCNPNPYGHGEAIEKLISQRFRDKAHIHTFISGTAIHTVAYPSPDDTQLAKTYSGCCIISYCPMCGRPLKREEDSNG